MNNENCGGAVKAPKHASPPSYQSETLRSIHLSGDSSRFRIHNYTTTSVANTALTKLEFGYTCFVEDLGRRSAGLTVNGRELSDSPYCKMNVYNVGSLGANTAANTGTESTTGLTFLNAVTQYLTTPSHRSRIRSCVGIHGKVAGEPNSHRCLAGNNCAVRGQPHSVCAHARGSTIRVKATRWLISRK